MMGETGRDREARLDALLDKSDIYDCLTRMSRGADRRDRDHFLSGCHADAIVSVGPFVGSPAELFDWSSLTLVKTNSGTAHNILNFTCELEGDTAHTETYYLFTAKNLDGTNLLAGGRYIDRFERRGGVWGLAVRNNMIEWSSILPGLDNPLNDVADLHLNGRATRDENDISYLRPLENRRAGHVPPLG
jgi:hypothetical protein